MSRPDPQPESPLIPLTPLPAAALFEAAVRFLRRQPGPVLQMGAIAGFAVAVANLVAWGTVYPSLAQRLTDLEPLAADPQAADQNAAALALVEVLTSAAALFAVIALISWPVYAIVNGWVIHAVGGDVFGTRASFGAAARAVAGRTGALLGQVLMIAGIVAVSTVPVAVSLSMAGSQPAAGLGLAMLLTPWCLLALLLVMPRLVLAPVCLVLEDVSVSASFVRARHLAKGSFWRVVGIVVGGLLITRVISAVVGLPFGLLAGAEPLSTQSVFMTSLGRIAGTAVSFPILSAIVTLLYVDLRVRKEGLRA